MHKLHYGLMLVLLVFSCRAYKSLEESKTKLIEADAQVWRKAPIVDGVVDVDRGSKYLFPQNLIPATIKEYLAVYSKEELEQIKTFTINSFGLTSIEGLSMLANLEVIDLGFNNIKIINVDEFPIKVRIVSLTSNKMDVVPDLSKLVNLQELDVSNNNIVDISKLELCSNLKGINIDYNPVQDISVFLKLLNLKAVSATLTALDDIVGYNNVLSELRNRSVIVYPE